MVEPVCHPSRSAYATYLAKWVRLSLERGYGCVDYHAADIGGPHNGALDLHQRVKLGFEEAPLYEGLDVSPLSRLSDAPGVSPGDTPAALKLLGVGGAVQVVLG